jgi:hypothetical protein
MRFFLIIFYVFFINQTQSGIKGGLPMMKMNILAFLKPHTADSCGALMEAAHVRRNARRNAKINRAVRLAAAQAARKARRGYSCAVVKIPFGISHAIMQKLCELHFNIGSAPDTAPKREGSKLIIVLSWTR